MKHSLTLTFFFADVSKNGTPYSSASAWPRDLSTTCSNVELQHNEGRSCLVSFQVAFRADKNPFYIGLGESFDFSHPLPDVLEGLLVSRVIQEDNSMRAAMNSV